MYVYVWPCAVYLLLILGPFESLKTTNFHRVAIWLPILSGRFGEPCPQCTPAPGLRFRKSRLNLSVESSTIPSIQLIPLLERQYPGDQIRR